MVLEQVPRVEQVQRTLYRLSDQAREARADDGYRDAAHQEDTVQARRSGADNPTIRLDRGIDEHN